jgi:hypothetical protein
MTSNQVGHWRHLPIRVRRHATLQSHCAPGNISRMQYRRAFHVARRIISEGAFAGRCGESPRPRHCLSNQVPQSMETSVKILPSESCSGSPRAPRIRGNGRISQSTAVYMIRYSKWMCCTIDWLRKHKCQRFSQSLLALLVRDFSELRRVICLYLRGVLLAIRIA